jgi:hypothetical protein
VVLLASQASQTATLPREATENHSMAQRTASQTPRC